MSQRTIRVSELAPIGALYAFFLVGTIQQKSTLFSEVAPIVTSVVLVLTCMLACVLHIQTSARKRSSLLWCTSAWLVGMAVEIAGVNTGFPFGTYHYSERLVPHVAGVPLVIGCAWTLVCVLGADIAARLRASPLSLPLIGSAAVTLLDVAMEPAAIEMKLWFWEGAVVPLSNYTAWFVTSLAILALGQLLQAVPQRPNSFLAHLYIGQLLFFLAVGSL